MISNIWESILDCFGHSHFLLFTIGSMIALGLTFWLTNAFFIFIDVTGKPGFLRAYKIQENQNVPVDWKLFKKCVRVVNRNQGIATIMILAIYPLTLWRDQPYKSEDLPSIWRLLMVMVMLGIFHEISFYYLHRLMHHHYLYKRIHKVHHEWTAPISLAVVYVHPFEHVIVNMMPTLAFPIIFRLHLATSWFCFFTITVISTLHHSGYHFPFMPSPEFHDYHHLKFNQCFGVLGILDRLHNTDAVYRKTKQAKVDHMYFSLKPIS